MNVDGRKRRNPRYTAHATLTPDELARVKQLAQRRGLTVAGLVRRAINYLLLDEDDDTEPLAEVCGPRGRRRPQRAA